MNPNFKKDKIIIIDFGSQVTKLIARRIREYSVFAEILTLKDLKKKNVFQNVKGVILSGGPSTVTKKLFQKIPNEILNLNVPILGICYGLQLIARQFNGKVKTNIKKTSTPSKKHVIIEKKNAVNTKTNKLCC